MSEASRSNTTLMDLPNEILIEILMHVNVRNRVQTRLNKRLDQIVKSMSNVLHMIELNVSEYGI